jgi:hypothetical protein
MTTNYQLAVACGCTLVLFGSELHAVACTTAHEEQLDPLWSQWCAVRGVPYDVTSVAST